MLIWECEKDAGGVNCREECDMGSYNSATAYADLTYNDIYTHACSSDCKLIQNKYPYDAAVSGSIPVKWDCVLNTGSPVTSHVPVNMTRVVYEMTCTYLCGNQVYNTGETSDLGGWGFTGQSNTGYAGEVAGG